MIPTNSIFFVLALVAVNLVPATDGQLTDTVRMVGLNAHNTLRSTVALGNAVNKNGTKLPKATNMLRVSLLKCNKIS